MAYIPAWTSLFLGLFLIAAAIGELRRPGLWHRTIEEIDASPALQMVAGLLELALGAFLYIGGRAAGGDDWLAVATMLLGGLMVAEALVVMALSDLYIRFWMRKLGTQTRGWASFVAVLGAACFLAGFARFF
ncbi:MAG: hypothetical protein EP321_03635 [Sphingomonadales bacterium]|nr:MAG: hypothetical protein EP345_18560 [Sphingomonadales bacterium]TNF05368.1 MAG: hypothetical protein EP321_03635 [Sphingomonadales bacterium]